MKKNHIVKHKILDLTMLDLTITEVGIFTPVFGFLRSGSNFEPLLKGLRMKALDLRRFQVPLPSAGCKTDKTVSKQRRFIL